MQHGPGASVWLVIGSGSYHVIEVAGDAVHVAVDPLEPIDESINRAEIVRIEKGGGVFPPISGESTNWPALRHEFPRRK